MPNLCNLGLIHTCEILGKSLCLSKTHFPHVYVGFLRSNGMYLHSVPELMGHNGKVVVVQSLRCIRLFVTPWTEGHQPSLSFTISQSLLKLMSVELVNPSNHLILCRPFSSCPQFFPVSRPFPMSHFFASGGQSVGASASASASVLPISIQG